MEQAKVYFSDLRCQPGTSLLNKLEKLIRTAGIGQIDFDRKLVAIKMHFGEPGNLAFLRPQLCQGSGRCGQEPGRRTLPYGLQHPVPGPPKECPGASGCGL